MANAHIYSEMPLIWIYCTRWVCWGKHSWLPICDHITWNNFNHTIKTFHLMAQLQKWVCIWITKSNVFILNSSAAQLQGWGQMCTLRCKNQHSHNHSLILKIHFQILKLQFYRLYPHWIQWARLLNRYADSLTEKYPVWRSESQYYVLMVVPFFLKTRMSLTNSS